MRSGPVRVSAERVGRPPRRGRRTDRPAEAEGRRQRQLVLLSTDHAVIALGQLRASPTDQYLVITSIINLCRLTVLL